MLLKIRERKQKIPVGKYPELAEKKITVKLLNRLKLFWKRKKAIIGAGVLATGLLITGQWGLVLQIVGSSLIGLEGVHEIGRQSKYGEKGQFKKDDLVSALKDLLEALIRVVKLIGSKPKL